MFHHHFAGLLVLHRHVFVHHDGRGEVHGEAHNQAEAHLTYNLEFALHALLVVLLDFQVVVGKSERATPDGGHNHQHHIHIVEFTEQQAGDDDTAHGGGALLLHLTLQAEIAHNLAHLHELEAFDDFFAEHDGDKKRQHQG